mgnify:CR=1 FL=1
MRQVGQTETRPRYWPKKPRNHLSRTIRMKPESRPIASRRGAPVSKGENRQHCPYSRQHGCASLSSHGSKMVMIQTAPLLRRRTFLHLAAVTALAAAGRAVAQQRRFTIGFANLTDDPGARIEGLGFTGEEVRSSFVLGARSLPIDLVLYDNARERAKAVANAEDAVQRKVDLYIQYCDDQAANDEVARRLAAARIPVLAVNFAIGNAPLYSADNREAGRLAGDALGRFALTTWPGRLLAAAILGAVKDPRRPSKIASPGSPRACIGIFRTWCQSSSTAAATFSTRRRNCGASWPRRAGRRPWWQRSTTRRHLLRSSRPRPRAGCPIP